MEEEKVPTETCALCGQAGADKKFGGQFWHKSCLRTARKQAKKMMH